MNDGRENMKPDSQFSLNPNSTSGDGSLEGQRLARVVFTHGAWDCPPRGSLEQAETT